MQYQVKIHEDLRNAKSPKAPLSKTTIFKLAKMKITLCAKKKAKLKSLNNNTN